MGDEVKATPAEKAAAAATVERAAEKVGVPLTAQERSDLVERVLALEKRPAMTRSDVEQIVREVVTALAAAKPTPEAKKETERRERTRWGQREV